MMYDTKDVAPLSEARSRIESYDDILRLIDKMVAVVEEQIEARDKGEDTSTFILRELCSEDLKDVRRFLNSFR